MCKKQSTFCFYFYVIEKKGKLDKLKLVARYGPGFQALILLLAIVLTFIGLNI